MECQVRYLLLLLLVLTVHLLLLHLVISVFEIIVCSIALLPGTSDIPLAEFNYQGPTLLCTLLVTYTSQHVKLNTRS